MYRYIEKITRTIIKKSALKNFNNLIARIGCEKTLCRLIGMGCVIAFAGWLALTSNFGPVSTPHAAEKNLMLEGARLAREGKNGVIACAQCHGLYGEGDRSQSVPRLAGLSSEYIKKQLADFTRNPPNMGVTLEPIARDYSKTPRVQIDLTVLTPGIRRSETMQGIAMALSMEEASAVALYYSSLTFVSAGYLADPETLARGEDLALRGKPEYGVPACIACHGPNGAGVGAQFPPLIGQPPEYLKVQLNAWQSGERDNDPMALMRSVAEQLTDGDKVNVAAYFANISVSAKP